MARKLQPGLGVSLTFQRSRNIRTGADPNVPAALKPLARGEKRPAGTPTFHKRALGPAGQRSGVPVGASGRRGDPRRYLREGDFAIRGAQGITANIHRSLEMGFVYAIQAFLLDVMRKMHHDSKMSAYSLMGVAKAVEKINPMLSTQLKMKAIAGAPHTPEMKGRWSRLTGGVLQAAATSASIATKKRKSEIGVGELIKTATGFRGALKWYKDKYRSAEIGARYGRGAFRITTGSSARPVFHFSFNITVLQHALQELGMGPWHGSPIDAVGIAPGGRPTGSGLIMVNTLKNVWGATMKGWARTWLVNGRGIEAAEFAEEKLANLSKFTDATGVDRRSL